MMKLRRLCNVTRMQNKKERTPTDMAQDLEKALVQEATELLKGSVEKHAHWKLLAESAAWVQMQCAAAPSESDQDRLFWVFRWITMGLFQYTLSILGLGPLGREAEAHTRS